MRWARRQTGPHAAFGTLNARGDSTLADAFCNCPLEQSQPWLRDAAWDDQHSDESLRVTLASLVADDTIAKDAVARLMVSALPYLEIAARRGCRADAGSVVDLLIHARSAATGRIQITTRYRLEKELRTTLAGMPSEYAVLLHGWTDRRLSVVV